MRIRHMYGKIIIYGMLLALCILITTGLKLSGVTWDAIVLIFGIIVITIAAVYLVFDRLALWHLRAKILNRKGQPRLHGIVDGLSMRIGIKSPRIAVINSPVADAFVGGTTRGRAIVFITTASLIEFNDFELEAILAHELESIDEMGMFIYNLVMMGVSALLIAYNAAMNSLLLGNATIEQGVVVDKARLSDIPAITRLLIAHGMYNYVYLHRLTRLSKQGSPLFLAAYKDGKPAGFILGEIDDPLHRTVHICKFIVDGRYQRMGIGGRLLCALIDNVKSSGFRNCHLEVRADNLSAISLYEKMEFKRLTHIPGFYPGGVDGLKLVRAVAKND